MSTHCRIIFDSSKCATIGLCEMTAPEFFSIPDDGGGETIVLHDIVDAAHRDEVEKAAANCPTQAIQIVDA
nr:MULTISPECIES: ferredoxin [unclassified Mycolicibacterium]